MTHPGVVTPVGSSSRSPTHWSSQAPQRSDGHPPVRFVRMHVIRTPLALVSPCKGDRIPFDCIDGAKARARARWVVPGLLSSSLSFGVPGPVAQARSDPDPVVSRALIGPWEDPPALPSPRGKGRGEGGFECMGFELDPPFVPCPVARAARVAPLLLRRTRTSHRQNAAQGDQDQRTCTLASQICRHDQSGAPGAQGSHRFEPDCHRQVLGCKLHAATEFREDVVHAAEEAGG